MKLLAFLHVCLISLTLFAQTEEKTVGVISKSNEVYEGYTLFSPARDSNVYLINNCGALIHQWITDKSPGNAVYLMEDGSLYRAGQLLNEVINAGGAGGIVEKFDWDGNRTWSYSYSSDDVRAHHDFQVLPNGNVLILAWESFSRSEAEAKGMDPSRLDVGVDQIWPEHIIEVKPSDDNGGSIVWEWHAWDHMIQDFDDTKDNYGVVADSPGKIDINHVRPGRTREDWMHANSINYNPDLDQILISVLYFDEVWIIDHNTTTEEARGEKGDLLYRWGNPQAYNHGDADDQRLFGQHNAQWIEPGLPDEGKILIFNNGQERFEDASLLYTSIVKIDPTLSDGNYQRSNSGTYLPEDYFYEYTKEPRTDFYSRFISGAQQLPNGNILIDDGAHGTFFEINENEEIVWEYINPITVNGPLEQGESTTAPNGSGLNTVFRCTKYAPNYSAFNGKELVPGATIEIGGDFEICEPLSTELEYEVLIYPNPTSKYLHINGNSATYKIFDIYGRQVKGGELPKDRILDVSGIKSGLYFIDIGGNYLEKIVINR
ncbi:aryl-sulfate sulfotransferase [Ekhidna sp.]